MSRRDRLATVAKVAALRETVARGRVGVATVQAEAARALSAAAREAVEETTVGSGSTSDVLAALAAAQRRAESATLADAGHRGAVHHRTTELAGWTAAAQRARLLADLAARQRDERERALESRQQRLVDDLSGGRAGTRAGVSLGEAS